jgi:hypothetical protein
MIRVSPPTQTCAPLQSDCAWNADTVKCPAFAVFAVINMLELNVPAVVNDGDAGTMTAVLKSMLKSYEITWQFVRSPTVTGIAKGPPGVATTTGKFTFRTSVPPPGFAHPTIIVPPGIVTISVFETFPCSPSRNAKRDEFAPKAALLTNKATAIAANERTKRIRKRDDGRVLGMIGILLRFY